MGDFLGLLLVDFFEVDGGLLGSADDFGVLEFSLVFDELADSVVEQCFLLGDGDD